MPRLSLALTAPSFPFSVSALTQVSPLPVALLAGSPASQSGPPCKKNGASPRKQGRAVRRLSQGQRQAPPLIPSSQLFTFATVPVSALSRQATTIAKAL